MEFVMEMAGAEQIEELVEIMEDAARNVQKKGMVCSGRQSLSVRRASGKQFCHSGQRAGKSGSGRLFCRALS